MHRVLTHRLDHEQVVDAVLDGLGVVFRGSLMEIVILGAPGIVYIRVGMALTFAPIMRLDAANSVLF